MSAPVRSISPTDPNDTDRDRSLLDQASACKDTDRDGVGSSPLNDATSSRVMVLLDPTPVGKPRQLLRLAAIAVPPYGSCRVRGLRQAVGIGTVLADRGSETVPPTQYVVEIDQTSPFWAFQDGNISWHLRFIHGVTMNATYNIGVSTPGRSLNYTGTDSSRLITNDGSTPAARGYPPGKPLGGLGTFRDIRYPWGIGEVATLDFEVHGPGVLGLYASVKQTDPATRQKLGPLLPPGTNTSVLSREDQFLLAFPDAVYRHVSGAILCEFGTLTRRPGANPTQGETPCG